MNERIRELARRAGFMFWQDEEWNPGDVVDWSCKYDAEMEKFAELIVRECANIAYEYDAPKMSGPGMIIAGTIQEHFGVGE